MKTPTFLDLIPAASLLEQQEFQDPDVQDKIERLIKGLCMFITCHRHLLIQGQTIETVTIEFLYKNPVSTFTDRGFFGSSGRLNINSFILKIVQRSFELQGYAWKVDSNHKLLISVKNTNQIERVDDLTLMQTVAPIFVEALGVVGIRR
jgi:hypothetical protein